MTEYYIKQIKASNEFIMYVLRTLKQMKSAQHAGLVGSSK